MQKTLRLCLLFFVSLTTVAIGGQKQNNDEDILRFIPPILGRHLITGWASGGSFDGYGFIIHTVNSGRSWERQGAGQITNVSLGGVWAVDKDYAWVVGASDSGYSTIYRTTNGGQDWLRQGNSSQIPDNELHKIAASSRLNAWAVGSGGTIVHTTNGGDTWAQQNTGSYTDILFQGVWAVDENNAWITGGSSGGYATILRTYDGGYNWTRQVSPDVTNVSHLLGIAAADTNIAWTVGENQTILHTADGGITWVEQFHGVPKDANELHVASSSEVWVVCDSSVFSTTNGGQSWQHRYTPPEYSMDITASDGQVWIVSRYIFDGVILFSRDNGQNWSQQLINTNLQGLFKVSLAPR